MTHFFETSPADSAKKNLSHHTALTDFTTYREPNSVESTCQQISSGLVYSALNKLIMSGQGEGLGWLEDTKITINSFGG